MADMSSSPFSAAALRGAVDLSALKNRPSAPAGSGAPTAGRSPGGGTAAVIAPVRRLVSNDEVIGNEDDQPGEVTMSLRQQLLDIQTGRVEDTHGWLTRLA